MVFFAFETVKSFNFDIYFFTPKLNVYIKGVYEGFYIRIRLCKCVV